MLKRLVAISMITAICLSTLPVIGATNSTPSNWAKATVSQAIKDGIVPTRLQKDYQKPITREEFCEIIMNKYLSWTDSIYDESEDCQELGYYSWGGKLKCSEIVRAIKSPDFSDASYDYVKAAYIVGLVEGTSATTFSPNTNIQRQEAAMMLCNYMQSTSPNTDFNYTERQFTGSSKSSTKDMAYVKYKDYAKIASWALEAVDLCYTNDLMRGDASKFDPQGYYTREQAIVTIQKLKGGGSFIELKGKVPVGAEHLFMGWEVGKDYVRLNPSREIKALTDTEKWIYNARRKTYFEGECPYEPTLDQGMISLTVGYALNYDRVYVIMEDIGKHSKWDYGFMTVSSFNSDSLLEFKFKHIKGFVTYSYIDCSFTYGRDKRVATPKQVE